MYNVKEHGSSFDSLLPGIHRVLIGCVAVHPVISDVAQLRDGVATNWLRFNPKIPDDTLSDVTEPERNRAPIAILARAVRKARPPGLSVPVNASYGVRIDDEVVPPDDKPGGPVLDEDNAVRVIRIQPVVDIWFELEEN